MTDLPGNWRDKLASLAPSRSLRTRLALAMGASGLMVGVLLSGFLEWRLEKIIVDSAHRDLQIVANDLSARLASNLLDRQREIMLTAELIVTAGITDPGSIRPLLERLKQYQPAYAWIGLTDASGKILAGSGGLLEGVDASARPWFAGARQGPYLGDPHAPKLLARHVGPDPDGEPPRLVDVAVPITPADGEAPGVLASHLHWHWVKNSVAAAHPLAESAPVEILIADRDGNWLLKPATEQAASLAAFMGSAGTPERYLWARASTPSGTGGLGWTILVRQEKLLAFAPIDTARQLMLLFSLVASALFSWLCWRLAGHVARPIITLAREVRAVHPETGFTSSLAGRPDEVGFLGQTIHGLFDDVRRHQLHLETLVAERTAELQAAHNHFRDFVLRAPIAMCLVEADGRITLRNEHFLATFGYGEAEVPTLADWWPRAYPDPAYRAWVMATWAEAADPTRTRNRAVTPLEYQVTCADGRVRDMEISGVTLGSGFLATFFDVTSRKAAEAELRLRRQEAEAASQAKSDFLATMSHEIRTPMNAILGTAQVLERSILDADQRHLVGSIRTAGRSLLNIINVVLDLAKIEAGRFELEHAPFVLHNVLSNLVDVLTPSAAAKGLSLKLTPMPEGIDALVGDAQRLGQILYNLAGNAIKFTNAGGIAISVTLEDGRPGRATLRFAVRDTGIGIAPDQIGRLFTPFTQAGNAAQQAQGGTGLGLSICRQLVTLMGGDIGVESQPGQGSEFWFAIPFETLRMAAPETRAGLEGARGAAGAGHLAGLHILVVDDSPVNREVAQRLLSLEGAACQTAGSGGEALDRLRAAPAEFDLILMDVQMPEPDGLATTRAIRADPGLAGLPVIALTAGALPSQRERAIAAGMDDFIAKPFELDALVAVILRRVGDRLPAPAGGTAAPADNDGGFPAIPGIDSRRAAQRLLGDQIFFFSALRALRAEFADAAAQTRADLASGDLAAAARRLHKLRGVAGNVAAEEVAALAGELEAALEAASSGRREAKALDNRIDALGAALARLIAGLPTEEKRSQDAAANAADEIDKPKEAKENDAAAGSHAGNPDPAALARLLAALDNGDMEAFRHFETLHPALVARHGADEMDHLTQAMDSLRFAEVAARLRAGFPST